MAPWKKQYLKQILEEGQDFGGDEWKEALYRTEWLGVVWQKWKVQERE